MRERLLTDALGLVRGPLLVDRPEGRYGWLAHEIIDAQLPLLVADVALALSEHHLEQGRPEQAVAALTVALSSSPNDERLWNELLRATHATGDTERLAVLAASLVARADEPGDVGRGCRRVRKRCWTSCCRPGVTPMRRPADPARWCERRGLRGAASQRGCGERRARALA